MKEKNIIPSKLLWVDLEMTGLEPAKDVLLEVSAEITDFSFKTLANYDARIKQRKEVVAKRMQENIWWRDFTENRDDFLNNLNSGLPLEQVEQELISLVKDQFKDEPAVLAGNSIHSDRAFIQHWMPEFDLLLHYRMLDVSSWKIVMQGKYGAVYEKNNSHRAFDDIQASIAELQYYLDWFKNHSE